MSNPNDKPVHVPDYDGQRTVISLGDEPATRPIPVKEPAPKSPQISNAEMSAEAVVGLQASSRRIKLVQTLDIFLRHRSDMLDDAEALVAELLAKTASAG